MEAQKTIVLEYSPSQRAFHRHSLLDHIKSNMKALGARRPTDYLIIATFSSYDEATKLFPLVKAELAKMLPEIEMSDTTVEQLLKG